MDTEQIKAILATLETLARDPDARADGEAALREIIEALGKLV